MLGFPDDLGKLGGECIDAVCKGVGGTIDMAGKGIGGTIDMAGKGVGGTIDMAGKVLGLMDRVGKILDGDIDRPLIAIKKATDKYRGPVLRFVLGTAFTIGLFILLACLVAAAIVYWSHRMLLPSCHGLTTWAA